MKNYKEHDLVTFARQLKKEGCNFKQALKITVQKSQGDTVLAYWASDIAYHRYVPPQSKTLPKN